MKDILSGILLIIGMITLIVIAMLILGGAIFCCIQLITATETIEVLRYGFLLLLLFQAHLSWGKK